MAGDADTLLDRRLLKRRMTWWRTLAVVLGTALAVLAITRTAGLGGRDYVARLTIKGIITQRPDQDDALDKLLRDGHAKALIVRIDSPGGTVVGGEALYLRLRRVAAKKPVVAVMGTLAASAAYMGAIGADHIVAHRGTITGSIGVILQTTNIKGLLDKLGISTEAIKSGPLKAVPSPFEPISDQARAAMRAVIMDVHAMFVDLVAERRGLARPAVVKLADGRIFTGRQALAAKLVDRIGGETEARAWLASKHGVGAGLPVKDIDPKVRRFPFWPTIGSWLGEKTLFTERLTLDGLVSLWHPDLR